MCESIFCPTCVWFMEIHANSLWFLSSSYEPKWNNYTWILIIRESLVSSVCGNRSRSRLLDSWWHTCRVWGALKDPWWYYYHNVASIHERLREVIASNGVEKGHSLLNLFLRKRGGCILMGLVVGIRFCFYTFYLLNEYIFYMNS